MLFTRHETRITAFMLFTKHETRITAFLPSRQARGLQGGMYEAVRKRVERGLSESREKNNDFFRIPTRFTTRNIPLFPTMRRKDSDKPLPPINRPRALRQPGYRLNLHVSPRGEAKWVRGPSGLGASRAEEKGARRLARAGVFAKSPPSPLGSRNTASPVHRPSDVSSGVNQAPSHGFHESRDTKHESRPFFACFDRRVVRHAGWCPRAARTAVPAARSMLGWACSRGMARLSRGMRGGGEWGVSQCLCTVSHTRSVSRRASFAADPVVPRTPWAVAKAQ